MKRILPCLFFLFVLLLPMMAGAQDDPVTLYIATDMHIIAPQLTDMGASFTYTYENGDGKLMRYADEIMRAFIDEVIAAQPDGLILSGDITFEGAKLSHEYLASLLMQVEEAGVPVYVLPGNHDIGSRVAAQYHDNTYTLVDSVTPDEFAAIHAAFGYDDALARDPASLSYAAQLAPGLRLLMLDTNTPSAPNALRDETLEFAARQLLLAQIDGERVITVTHQSLLSHNDLFNAGLMGAGFMFEGAETLLALLEGTDVIANLSGHMHIQHIKASDDGLTEIATSSLVVSPCQYGVLTLCGGTADYHTQAVDVSSWAQKKGLDDPDLLDFAAYARSFFSLVCSKADANLPPDIEDREWLVAAYEDLHAAYFSGRLDTMTGLDRERFAPWLENAGLFTYMYLNSILEEEFIDHTRLIFPY